MAASVFAAMTQPITLHSHWRGKRSQIEVVVTRVNVRLITYIAIDKSVSGTVSEWQFRQDFQPLPDNKKKMRGPA
jgi:hypothetical protein